MIPSIRILGNDYSGSRIYQNLISLQPCNVTTGKNWQWQTSSWTEPYKRLIENVIEEQKPQLPSSFSNICFLNIATLQFWGCHKVSNLRHHQAGRKIYSETTRIIGAHTIRYLTTPWKTIMTKLHIKWALNLITYPNINIKAIFHLY